MNRFEKVKLYIIWNRGDILPNLIASWLISVFGFALFTGTTYHSVWRYLPPMLFFFICLMVQSYRAYYKSLEENRE